MPARFDDVVPFFGNTVIAIGPLHTGDHVDEVCAWVFQRDGDNDAAATEMTTQASGAEAFQQIDGERWLLPLQKISNATFHDGRAFSVAVALMTDSDGNQRVTWWGQPVDLVQNEASVRAAAEKGALESAPLNEPASLPSAA